MSVRWDIGDHRARRGTSPGPSTFNVGAVPLRRLRFPTQATLWHATALGTRDRPVLSVALLLHLPTFSSLGPEITSRGAPSTVAPVRADVSPVEVKAALPAVRVLAVDVVLGG